MLNGKWDLVTGATAGLGDAEAESLAGAGANVVLHDLIEPRETRDRLRARHGIDAISVAADLTQRAALATLVSNARRRPFAPVEHFPPDRWDEALAVNLSAPFHLIRLALPAMKQRGWGRIINNDSNSYTPS